MRRVAMLCTLSLLPFATAAAQDTTTYSHADSLRGSLTSPARTWWDVTFYDLHVRVHPADSTIAGYNAITYRVVSAPREMQIDLQAPLVMDSIVQDGRAVRVRRDSNAYFATLTSRQRVGETNTVVAYYHGMPHVSRRPPWSGGFTWTHDSIGSPWIVTTDEGIGASIWWPNKDIGADEPDSQHVSITLPDPLIDVGNGRLRQVVHHDDGTTTWEWAVVNPINNYAIAVNASPDYIHYSEIYHGENGPLTLDFWPLSYHLDAARHQWAQVKTMLQCFEHWFGPYPWYEDGYKLVEVPYPGMEHQSAVTYGNDFQDGYGHRDWSKTGLGMLWDFIIVHESAHEWFANNITAKDGADMWIHEGFANYAEGLYVECRFGKAAGARYIIGNRNWIRNDRPIIPAYGVNADGSEDMYPKGGNMLHTIRQIVNDDAKWRDILRGLNQTFWHQTVTTAQIEHYISTHAGVDLSKVFDEYLRTTMVPTLEYKIDGSTLSYRWTDVVPQFDMQVGVTLSDSGFTVIHPTETWQTAALTLSNPAAFAVDPNYYVLSKNVGGAPSR